jgi:hypothetical protein
MPRVLPGVPLPTASADALEPDDDESPVPSAEALDALYEFNLEEEPPPQPLAHQCPRPPSPTPTEPMYEPAEPGPFGVKKSLPLPPWVDDDYLQVVTLLDRRPSAPRPLAPVVWLVQRQLERALYPSEDDRPPTTGAFYQLLRKTEGAEGKALLLTGPGSVRQGLLTEEEWALFSCRCLPHENAKRLTLIPIDVAVAALRVYGRTPTTERLLDALELDWDDEEQRVEEEEEEDGGGDTEEDLDDDDDDGPSPPAGPAGGTDTEEGDEDDDDDDDAGQEPDNGGSTGCGPALEAQFAAYTRYRLAQLNRHRAAGACRPITADNDRAVTLRFFGWLEASKGVKARSLSVLLSPGLTAEVQAWVEHLVRTRMRRYSTMSMYLTCLINVTRYALAVCAHQGRTANASELEKLTALHKQCLQQARRDGKFDACTAHKLNWLDWAEVQSARVAATEAYELLAETADLDDDDGEARLASARDALIMTLLSHQPPDRVGVMRCLQLGVTLLRREGGRGYVLDLSQPNAHKTSAVFGPSRTTMGATVVKWLDIYLELCDKVLGPTVSTPYLFSKAGDCATPLTPTAWTRLVKACFLRHAGVPMAPKDLRASFITFLKSDNHGDDTLKAAAIAMRHSSKTQSSAAYTKDQSDRLVAKAVRAAEGYAALFG